MKDETRIRGAAGRKVLADPRTHRYYLCLNNEEDEKFISMFEPNLSSPVSSVESLK